MTLVVAMRRTCISANTNRAIRTPQYAPGTPTLGHRAMAAAQAIRDQRLQCRASSGSPLTKKRCEPCESAKDSMDYMGVAMTGMDRQTAEKYMDQLDSTWQIMEDSEHHLRLRKVMRTKNFKKALELFLRIGEVAETEQHHPDLHLEGWNNCTIDLWTHARSGLSENDFIVAAKIDQVDISDLLSKRQPTL